MVSSWFVMFHCHGSQCTCGLHVLSSPTWFVMFHCDGFVMVPWFSVMVCMVRHGSLSCLSLFVMDLLSWLYGSLSWLSSITWFVMCYTLQFICCTRSCDPLRANSVSNSRVLSFLMRLVLCFPFKEHTSKELC